MTTTRKRNIRGASLVRLLQLQGVEATAEELRVVPYRVEFSERLRERLADDA
jgi:hypothetical protein